MKHLVFAIAGTLLAGGLTVHANVISDFSTSDEGWRSVTLAFPDPGAPPGILATITPTRLTSGGNPGAYIFVNDPDGNVQYWLAPSKFLGDQSSAYSHNLIFSMADSPVATIFTQADIIFTGAGLTLTRQMPSAPNAVWNTYTIPMTETSWTVNTPAGAAASQAQFQSVLANLTGIYLRSEFYLSNDQQSLDSVTLETGTAPEPGTIAPVLLALALLLACLRRNHPSPAA